MEQAIALADPGQVLAKATARASRLLGMNGVMLAKALGLSEPTVSRILKAEKPIDPASKEGELALLLVRVYRSLDALVGTDDGKRQAWMTGFNKALGGVPLQMVQRVDGLVATLSYLDAMRAPT
ncbi:MULTISPECIES: MbcA/ParS/Xre antitoxin family protein [Comamonadaceae]|uniref:MbcA/ParS/Xre antitoxin family protein n=1 Tax=Acidovorax sacchari TaxID=3230736 RepID=UPI0034A15E81